MCDFSHFPVTITVVRCKLTTDANDVVGAIHPKAMPVILTKPEEIETWMTSPVEEALKLQRPLYPRSDIRADIFKCPLGAIRWGNRPAACE